LRLAGFYQLIDDISVDGIGVRCKDGLEQSCKLLFVEDSAAVLVIFCHVPIDLLLLLLFLFPLALLLLLPAFGLDCLGMMAAPPRRHATKWRQRSH
jgi:hypothetical protein